MPRAKKSFSPEFKEEAVKMVIETSRPIARVAKELGINEGTLGNWVGIYRREHAGEEPPLTVSERARLRELERETRELKMELEFMKKAAGILRPRPSVTEKFEFIDAEYAAYQASDDEYVPSIVKMCVWMEVSRSGFYEWRNAPESATVKRRGILALYVQKSFGDSDDTYGYRRVHADLVAWGVPAGPELVRSVMRELGLEPCQPRPWRVSLTEGDGQEHGIPDLVRRDFTAGAPGEKMVGDITYISTWEGWLFLATVIDCHTKAVIGWAVDDNYRTPLIQQAIEMGARNYPLAEGAIFHSDRGSNYTSGQFAATLKKYGLRQSVGRTGTCYDNAMAESFFAALKNECVYRTQYPTREHARRAVVRYIEFWYNSRRRHSGLQYRTPQQVHDEYLEQQSAA
ncbi:MAG TPA: IS3 family transposase [Streptosporangiaceae bacterium]|nr:IS3 family transposase [Streptosporangiaceae bacterium]